MKEKKTGRNLPKPDERFQNYSPICRRSFQNRRKRWAGPLEEYSGERLHSTSRSKRSSMHIQLGRALCRHFPRIRSSQTLDVQNDRPNHAPETGPMHCGGAMSGGGSRRQPRRRILVRWPPPKSIQYLF